jgi:hypothetical protein
MKAVLAMGRKLMRKVVTLVKPDAILAWQRRLEHRKWDYSRRRRRGPGRPRTPGEVGALVCRMTEAARAFLMESLARRDRVAIVVFSRDEDTTPLGARRARAKVVQALTDDRPLITKAIEEYDNVRLTSLWDALAGLRAESYHAARADGSAW